MRVADSGDARPLLVNGPALLSMCWRDILAAHWRADAAVLTALLPAGVVLDRFDGDAWLSVVPFRMTGVRVRFAPVLPGFANIPRRSARDRPSVFARAHRLPNLARGNRFFERSHRSRGWAGEFPTIVAAQAESPDRNIDFGAAPMLSSAT